MGRRESGNCREHLLGLALGLLCLAVLALVLLYRGPILAQTDGTDLLSETTIRDAIIGREDLSEFEREQIDLNADGSIDVADLVAFLKGVGATPKARFESFTSVTREGSGTAVVTVHFSRIFTGTLNYSLGASTTATEGHDFSPLAGTVSVNGESVEISIGVLDDLNLEAMETLELVLEDGADYEIGSPSTHKLFIDENDATWRGVIEQENASFGFKLEIRRNGSAAHGVLRGDDTGLIPESEPVEDGWPVQPLKFTETSFEAHIDNIPVPQEHTARLGTTFTRSFVLLATVATTQDTILDTELEIAGEVTEELVPDSPSFEHLRRLITGGTFALSRSPVRSDVPEAALEDAG